jgi:hypothetical protein
MAKNILMGVFVSVCSDLFASSKIDKSNVPLPSSMHQINSESHMGPGAEVIEISLSKVSLIVCILQGSNHIMKRIDVVLAHPLNFEIF